MKTLKYIIYKEGKYYVSQCLNIDISSFGKNIQEAKDNLMEAVTLYFEEENSIDNFLPIDEAMLGENSINI
ncbi:type II toxin-antitoxin system HicB family antitoxin [Bacteroidota bacterium]